MVYRTCLENKSAARHREFESHRFRQIMNQFTKAPSSNIEYQQLLLKRIGISLESARETLNGKTHFLVYHNLKLLLEEAQKAGVDISAIKTQIEETLSKLPKVEMENLLNEVCECLRSGNIGLAKERYRRVLSKVKYYKNEDILTEKEISVFQQQAEDLRVRLGIKKEK